MYSEYSYGQHDLNKLPPRKDESNKGDYGRLLCVCGSQGMCGAAYLSAKAAYRTGAGLVRILTAKENIIPLQTSLPEAIVTTYDQDAPDMDIVEEAVAWADAIVIGCGLGRSHSAQKILSTVIKLSDARMVVDADGLNIISAHPSLKKYLRNKIITPHALEMSRLTGMAPDTVAESAVSIALEFTRSTGAVCVLKRHNTVVADGSDKVYINQSGNNGMATAGSGDVLAGIIGGILAQNKSGKLSQKEAAALGVYIHGLAGDVAAERVGKYSLMASDIIDSISDVLNAL